MKTIGNGTNHTFLRYRKIFSNRRPVVAFLMTLFTLGLHSQNYLWAKNPQGSDADFSYHCCKDPQGNIIVTGFFFSPSITFGTVTLNNYSAESTADFFIVKYNSAGNVLWAKKAGGSCDDVGFSCTTDSYGNIYVTGVFTSSSITFGTFQLNNSTTVANSCSPGDIFLVKYSPNGNVLWAKKAGGNNFEYAYSCITDANQNVIITGYFESPSISFGTTNLINSGETDVLIAKYDSNGNILWAKKAGGTDVDLGVSCSTDGSGNIIVTGFFYSSYINFGTTSLSSSGESDVFIAKYASNGNLIWAKKAGGDDDEIGMSCSTDAYGNIILTGIFDSPSINFGTTQLTNSGETDIFIAKYASNGNLQWVKKAGGIDSDYSYACSVDISGNIILTGSYYSSSINFGSTSLPNVGGEDLFIAKYSSAGNLLWAKSAGGNGDEGGMSCITDGNHIVLTGYFYSPSINFGTHTLSNTGDYDIFILKMDGIVGVEEMLFNNHLHVFPNPSSGMFEIQLDGNSPTSAYELKIINFLGETVIQRTIYDEEKKITLNLSDFPKGCYLLQLTNEQTNITRKLVLK